MVKSGEREGEGEWEKDFKNLLLPCLCICRGEEAASCRSKRHRAGFFLKKRKKKLEVTQKWVMTICMLCSLYNIFVYLDIAFFVYF